MTREQWLMARRITALLTTEIGLTDRALAEHLGVTVAELRPVTGMLLGRGVISRCGDYLTVASQPDQGGAV